MPNDAISHLVKNAAFKLVAPILAVRVIVALPSAADAFSAATSELGIKCIKEIIPVVCGGA